MELMCSNSCTRWVFGYTTLDILDWSRDRYFSGRNGNSDRNQTIKQNSWLWFPSTFTLLCSHIREVSLTRWKTTQDTLRLSSGLPAQPPSHLWRWASGSVVLAVMTSYYEKIYLLLHSVFSCCDSLYKK